MQIEYKKKAVKYINSAESLGGENMSREAVKCLVDMIPEKDIDTIYRVLVRFVPEDKPTEEELEAIAEAKADTSPTVSHESIDWD